MVEQVTNTFGIPQNSIMDILAALAHATMGTPPQRQPPPLEPEVVEALTKRLDGARAKPAGSGTDEPKKEDGQ